MDAVISFIEANMALIVIGVCLIQVALALLVIASVKALLKQKKRYELLIAGTDGQSRNLERALFEYQDQVQQNQKTVKQTQDHLERLGFKQRLAIQRYGLVRYDALGDAGGHLSFSLALLNDEESGVILTSIYGRSTSSTYAKTVDKGVSSVALSPEEQEALQKAKK